MDGNLVSCTYYYLYGVLDFGCVTARATRCDGRGITASVAEPVNFQAPSRAQGQTMRCGGGGRCRGGTIREDSTRAHHPRIGLTARAHGRRRLGVRASGG